eukprot:COSAG06_NODE_3933_length_4750_cov_3.537734_5_plen_46_part_00
MPAGGDGGALRSETISLSTADGHAARGLWRIREATSETYRKAFEW